ncbi:hypothetical protein FB45DRAFT_924116 [Roridomyces roridus]|uniref:Uncharacterized protein n=1 Tax=Roridomyces roridus TaxID=1738132 RepID=A0AAD7BLN2_9AGAR|nr:hypothetical protein FB45DRAFT_924116 [Roridomyces roridus]
MSAVTRAQYAKANTNAKQSSITATTAMRLIPNATPLGDIPQGAGADAHLAAVILPNPLPQPRGLLRAVSTSDPRFRVADEGNNGGHWNAVEEWFKRTSELRSTSERRDSDVNMTDDENPGVDQEEVELWRLDAAEEGDTLRTIALPLHKPWPLALEEIDADAKASNEKEALRDLLHAFPLHNKWEAIEEGDCFRVRNRDIWEVVKSEEKGRWVNGKEVK